MTVRVKKTYKYLKYLFGAYALYIFVGGVIQNQSNPNKGDISLPSPIETVYADVLSGPPPGNGDAGCGGSCDSGGCCGSI